MFDLFIGFSIPNTLFYAHFIRVYLEITAISQRFLKKLIAKIEPLPNFVIYILYHFIYNLFIYSFCCKRYNWLVNDTKGVLR